jgi:hypothetical protein
MLVYFLSKLNLVTEGDDEIRGELDKAFAGTGQVKEIFHSATVQVDNENDSKPAIQALRDSGWYVELLFTADSSELPADSSGPADGPFGLPPGSTQSISEVSHSASIVTLSYRNHDISTENPLCSTNPLPEGC